jgi:hypothetical protein
VYLTSTPVLRAPRSSEDIKIYVATQDRVIGATLMQEDDSGEHVVAYLSRRLLDAETRYTFVEKLCLALYYVCTKCRHYLLSSTCMVVSQHDVLKYML